MIDAKKRALEARSALEFNKIFANMANDAARIYLAGGTVNAKQISENYRSEFLKEIRDIMRKTIKTFGFSLRSELNQKGFDFDLQNKLLEIDLNFKKVQEIDNLTDSQLEDINNKFLLASSLFVANQSEQKTNFITETNEKQINEAFAAALTIYTLQNDPKINERTFIANEAKKKIIEKGKSRSELIAEDNVGVTEAWSRQKEAELIHDAELITTTEKVVKLNKTWDAILDSKTRQWHATADGQQVEVKEKFIVGGELLDYPRDLNGSPSNTIQCRCNARYSFA